MSTATAETVHGAGARISERVTEAYQKAAQLSRDARGLPTLALEAMESGRRAAQDAASSVRRRAREFEHVPEDVAYHVRRAPFWTMGGAFGTGMLLGAAIGWLACRPPRRND
jgi:hypothetical protein